MFRAAEKLTSGLYAVVPAKRLLPVCVVLGVLLLGVAPAMADIGMTPFPVKTGKLITFTAGPDGPGYTWDLDGDGLFDDKTGSPATWAYPTPGPVTVAVKGMDGTPVTRTFVVDGPSAAFVSFPTAPLPGELVTFAYSSKQATPPDSPPEWDFNGDGTFGDARGPTATYSFPAPGQYAVGLRVADLDGAVSTGIQIVSVRAPDPVIKLTRTSQFRLMTPFPVVRIAGKVTRRGARIKHLTVTAPLGSTVSVRCRGKGCPFRRAARTVASTGSKKSPAKTVIFSKLEKRLLRGGASVKVLVSKPGEIGKYTLFKIRRSKPPARSDSCLQPGSTKPVECPTA